MPGREAHACPPKLRRSEGRKRKNNTYNSGLFAELLVMIWLLLHGYFIMAWRFKTHLGEVDIIARRGRTIAAVEVKARSRKPTGEEITANQCQRIADAMRLFMLKNSKYNDFIMRFDAALVTLPLRVEYRENAW